MNEFLSTYHTKQYMLITFNPSCHKINSVEIYMFLGIFLIFFLHLCKKIDSLLQPKQLFNLFSSKVVGILILMMVMMISFYLVMVMVMVMVIGYGDGDGDGDGNW